MQCAVLKPPCWSSRQLPVILNKQLQLLPCAFPASGSPYFLVEVGVVCDLASVFKVTRSEAVSDLPSLESGLPPGPASLAVSSILDCGEAVISASAFVNGASEKVDPQAAT